MSFYQDCLYVLTERRIVANLRLCIIAEESFAAQEHGDSRGSSYPFEASAKILNGNGSTGTTWSTDEASNLRYLLP